MWKNCVLTNFVLVSLGIAVILFGVTKGSHPSQTGGGQTRQVRYQYFDDYLIGMSEDLESQERTRQPATQSHHRGRQTSVQPSRDFAGRLTQLFSTSDDEDVVDGSTQGLKDTEDRPRSSNVPSPASSPNVNILAYFRDVPKQHWSCCMLGVLAGDKGFHCQAQFYQARIVFRNRNRAHNRRLPFYGRNRNPTYGKDIMYHFQGCVERHAAEFHKCCYAATLERLEMDRWRRYRAFVSNARGQ